ncbi:MAG: hypothetical protein HOQ45_03390, partial [Nocardioidaceae bacterium]|nr:hypothetical protein [Nocardioidaceae bacterium]
MSDQPPSGNRWEPTDETAPIAAGTGRPSRPDEPAPDGPARVEGAH